MKHFMDDERSKRTVFLCAAMGAVFLLASCDSPAGPSAAPARPAAPFIRLVENYNQYDEGADDGSFTVNRGGKIEVSWKAVPWASEYEVYYAPRTASPPERPAAPTLRVAAASATIAGAGIGETTMNYYVWIRAGNSVGVSEASDPASSLDYFAGRWDSVIAEADDFYLFTGRDFIFDMSSWGRDWKGYIRAVRYEEGPRVVNGRSGTAGVIVFEYDRAVDGSGWAIAGGRYFSAQYFYAAEGHGGAGSRVWMGTASNVGHDPDGCETAALGEALSRFTFANISDWYSFLPGVEARYEWTAHEP